MLILRELGEDLMASLLLKLTDGMTNVLAEGMSFSGGPLGEIQGLLDQFGLNFNDLITEFMDRHNTFMADLVHFSQEKEYIFQRRPLSLPQFPNILQIGSKMPSAQYSMELNYVLWDKLAAAFPWPTFNGVKIPNIPFGRTFSTAFPRGKFPGEATFKIRACQTFKCTRLT